MGRYGKKIIRVLLWLLAGMLLSFFAVFALLPYIITSIDYPELQFDLSEKLGKLPPGVCSNKTVTARFQISRHQYGEGYRLNVSGRFLDWDFTADADVSLRMRLLGVDVNASANMQIKDAPWGVDVELEASLPGEWRVNVSMPKSKIDQGDPFIGLLIHRLLPQKVSALSYSGDVEFLAKAERTTEVPVPKWTAKCRIEGLSAQAEVNGAEVSITGVRTSFSASGIADHVDIAPAFPHVEKITYGRMSLTNAFASIRSSESGFLVTEAGADLCGGRLRMYSFFLNPKRGDAGVTLYVDGMDVGEVLAHIKGFSGVASGRLNGRFPLFVKGMEKIRLKDGYLHSIPGETGKIQINDSKQMVENLTMGGVPEKEADNIALALSNLDYKVIKIGLTPEQEGSFALSLKIEGNATHKGVTVPVSFLVTLHGDIEQLINTGFKTLKRQKG